MNAAPLDRTSPSHIDATIGRIRDFGSAIAAAEAEGVAGLAFNIAGGGSVTILQVLAELAAVAGRPLKIEHLPGRAGEVRHSEADISLARWRLGFTPGLSLRDGLALTLKAVQGEAEAAPETTPGRSSITLAAA